MNGLFVTGTGTGVGKSVVAASIVAGLTAGGRRVAAFKPVVTGLDEPETDWPRDHELLAAATGWQAARDVSPYTFGPAVSPHLAAHLAGTSIDPDRLIQVFHELAAQSEFTVCEGVGGLLVPLAEDPPFSVLDLAKRLALPAVVAARPGLGTISDTRLTVDRLRSEGIEVAAVVLSGWPADASSNEPTTIEASNRETVAKLLDVDVAVLHHTSPTELAGAGKSLPLASWIGDDGRGL